MENVVVIEFFKVIAPRYVVSGRPTHEYTHIFDNLEEVEEFIIGLERHIKKHVKIYRITEEEIDLKEYK